MRRRAAHPPQDSLAPHADKLKAGLNAPRSAALLVDCARFFANDLTITRATAVDVDSNGMTLICATSVAASDGTAEGAAVHGAGAAARSKTLTQELRVPFSRSARTPNDFHAAVAALASEARAGLGPSASFSNSGRGTRQFWRFFPRLPTAALTLLAMSLTFYLDWHPYPEPIPWQLVATLRDLLPPVFVKAAVYLILILHGLEAVLAIFCARAKGCSWNSTAAWATAVAVFGYGSFSRLVNDEKPYR